MRHPFLPKMADAMNKSSAREIFNVHHMKWYIFDDKVILTGGIKLLSITSQFIGRIFHPSIRQIYGLP